MAGQRTWRGREAEAGGVPERNILRQDVSESAWEMRNDLGQQSSGYLEGCWGGRAARKAQMVVFPLTTQTQSQGT